MQEALARQRAESASGSAGYIAVPIARSGSPWDSAWDQQSASTRGQGLSSHERLLSGLATARRHEHSQGVFGSVVESSRPSRHHLPATLLHTTLHRSHRSHIDAS